MGFRRPNWMGALLAVGSLPMAGGAHAEEAARGASVTASEARPPLLPVSTFAQRDLVSDPVMSPDGKRVATLVTIDGRKSISVLDLATIKSVAATVIGGEVEYGWHRWAGPDVVLFSVSQLLDVLGEETRVSRLVALRVSTGERWFVGPRQMGTEGDDLLHVAEDGSSVLLSFQKTIYDWPSVARVSLLDPKDGGKQVQRAVEGIWEWYADDQGIVRMGDGLVEPEVAHHLSQNH